MKSSTLAGLLLGVLIASTTSGLCQTPPQIIGVAQTDEQAIRLTWTSISNEVYQIQSTDSLIDTNTGTTTWQILYDDYPSQGTNTFWTDHGNYFYVPPILDPRFMPMRFYQVVDVGPDTTSDEPSVTITSPTNGTVASGTLTITVVASTDQATLATKLYVDGQEMRLPIDTTNWVDDSGLTNYIADTYTINTCEWLNETHVLFATAKCLSALEGPDDTPAALVGHAVSPFVPVTFSNLVTRISFSQAFFEPSLGQTQQVSAVFAANVNWTLQIRDINSNEVRTATGSGTSMLFNWDGNGDGETNLPPGVYYYYISAQTNGQAYQSPGSGGSDASSFSSMSLSSSEPGDSTILWAVPSNGSGSAVPLALYPVGADTNDLIIFEAPQTGGQIRSASLSSVQSFGFAADEGGGAEPSGSGAPASQSSPPAPVRPPPAPVDNSVGTFGAAYQTYQGNGAAGYTPASPSAGFGQYINLEGRGAANPPPYFGLRNPDSEAVNFALGMEDGGWKPRLNLGNDNLTISALRGSGNPFNQVNIGLLVLHGTYGTSQDFTAGGCEQMYFPIASGANAEYLRMSEMNFGGSSPTNGLKWMAIMACNSLYHPDWSSMQSQNIKPYNSNLHLLLGAGTKFFLDPNIGRYWAKNMFGSTDQNPMPIRLAWYAAGKKAYAIPYGEFINPTVFAVAGDGNCMNDFLQNKTNTVLSGSWTYDSQQVYP
jgi:hypothetical protein